MPFLVHIFADGKRKRADEGDVLVSPVTRRINARTTTNHLTLALTTLTSLVDNSFECSICLGTYSDPYVIPECLHRFCGACVKESIRKCGAECPKCRARITTKRGLRKDKELQSMVRRRSGAELFSFSQQECCRSTVHV